MFKYYGRTEKSYKKLTNQDNFLINGQISNDLIIKGSTNKNEILLAITDGVGSKSESAIASRLILEELAKKRNLLNKQIILNIIRNTNTYLLKEFNGNAQTVFTIVWIQNENMTIFHIGDTRVYLKTERNFQQLTNDHTYVQELFESGIISESRKYHHPKKNIIKQSLGGFNDIDIDIYTFILEPNQKLLLTSDGIHDYIPSNEIISSTQTKSLEKSINHLFSIAKENGSHDDLTAILLSYT